MSAHRQARNKLIQIARTRYGKDLRRAFGLNLFDAQHSTVGLVHEFLVQGIKVAAELAIKAKLPPLAVAEAAVKARRHRASFHRFVAHDHGGVSARPFERMLLP